MNIYGRSGGNLSCEWLSSVSAPRFQLTTVEEPKKRGIMKPKAHTTILAVIALTLFSAADMLAQTEHQHGAQKPMQHDMSKMDMSAMMNEPHHLLAMAYMKNLGTFAKTLHDQAASTSPLNAKFARVAVGEMKRSLDQMEEHHGEHMKMMSEEMRSHMATMMKDMDMHRSMLKDSVSALEKDVQADQPDSKQVAADSANVLKNLDEMSKMHDDKKMKM
jgi:alpha-L-fucosidase